MRRPTALPLMVDNISLSASPCERMVPLRRADRPKQLKADTTGTEPHRLSGTVRCSTRRQFFADASRAVGVCIRVLVKTNCTAAIAIVFVLDARAV